ncbi:hypothetical protein FVO59_12025 [Microbacterium esteraromaticum]|uniref:Uncharacterized protein n=1 Tax=Microbacterium esteraromaticum TaxID=57043 RepID=A0A7D7WIB2_9MICO|nr:hypothetical protein [Microbacterium esteraromaticum]QMU97853.1 hypothetical protein FVO59_12025 [Microbacterium esteraromaticum]
MVTNIGFDNEHPYVEEGADEGEVSVVGNRISVTDTIARAERVTIERSVDGGLTWEPVVDDAVAGDGINLVDFESLSYGDNLYRAVAFTAEGATSETEITVQARSGAFWLSGGPGYGDTGRLPLNPDVKHSGGRERALKEYAGRSKPVALVGEMTSRAVAVSGRVTDEKWIEETANIEDLIRIAQLPSRLFLFRDPDGRRMYGVLSDVDLDRLLAIQQANGIRGWNGLWGYSFTFTEAT